MYWYSDVDQETVLNEAIEALKQYANDIDPTQYVERWPNDEGTLIRFRIRLHNDRIYLHIGSPDYDKDHRGHIGAGLIDINDDTESIRESVQSTLDEAKERQAIK